MDSWSNNCKTKLEWDGTDRLVENTFVTKKIVVKWILFYFPGIHKWTLSSRNRFMMSHKHFQQQINNQTTQNIHPEKQCIKCLWSFLDSDLTLASGCVILSGRWLCDRQRRRRRPIPHTLFLHPILPASLCEQHRRGWLLCHQATQGFGTFWSSKQVKMKISQRKISFSF